MAVMALPIDDTEQQGIAQARRAECVGFVSCQRAQAQSTHPRVVQVGADTYEAENTEIVSRLGATGLGLSVDWG